MSETFWRVLPVINFMVAGFLATATFADGNILAATGWFCAMLCPALSILQRFEE